MERAGDATRETGRSGGKFCLDGGVEWMCHVRKQVSSRSEGKQDPEEDKTSPPFDPRSLLVFFSFLSSILRIMTI
jgi:hypothetical protein